MPEAAVVGLQSNLMQKRLQVYLDTSAATALAMDPCMPALSRQVAAAGIGLCISMYVVAECLATPQSDKREVLRSTLGLLVPPALVLDELSGVLRRSLGLWAASQSWESAYEDTRVTEGCVELLHRTVPVSDVEAADIRRDCEARNSVFDQIRRDARRHFRSVMQVRGELPKLGQFLLMLGENPRALEESMFKSVFKTIGPRFKTLLRGRVIDVMTQLLPWRAFALGEAVNVWRVTHLTKKYGRSYVPPGIIDTAQVVYMPRADMFVTNDKALLRLAKVVARGLRSSTCLVMTYTQWREAVLIRSMGR